MTSQNSVIYECAQCEDTGLVSSGDVMRRCSCAELRKIRNSWRNFGVLPEAVKNLEEYIPVTKAGFTARQKAEKYLKNYNLLTSIENNWFGLFGQPGAGKSHIIIAMGAALLNRKECPVGSVYMPYLEAMRELKSKAMEEGYLSILAKYQRAEVLIIDDMFKDKIRKNKAIEELSEADIKHIYPIINYRYYNKLPTIISSEAEPGFLLNLDEAIGGRILERCDENLIIFKGEENNYRLRKFKK